MVQPYTEAKANYCLVDSEMDLPCNSFACSHGFPWTSTHLPLLWARPQSKTGIKSNSTYREKKICRFTPWLEFLQMFFLNSWWFLGLEYVWVSLGPCIGWGPALVPVHSKSHAGTDLFYGIQPGNNCTQRNVAFQNWSDQQHHCSVLLC